MLKDGRMTPERAEAIKAFVQQSGGAADKEVMGMKRGTNERSVYLVTAISRFSDEGTVYSAHEISEADADRISKINRYENGHKALYDMPEPLGPTKYFISNTQVYNVYDLAYESDVIFRSLSIPPMPRSIPSTPTSIATLEKLANDKGKKIKMHVARNSTATQDTMEKLAKSQILPKQQTN